MPVIRVEKDANFTTMSNYHLRDGSISLRAVGLLSKMLSLPPEWDYTVSGLAAICKEGKDAIRSALQELECAGYMRREQTHNESGHFASNDYVIYEHPPLSAFPSTVKPTTDLPLTENPTQINKDINNNLNNNPPMPPKRGRRKPKTEPQWKPDRFEKFWNFYPPINGKRPAKDRAINAWDKLRPNDEMIARMGRALQRDKESEMWTRGIGIPYASSWLNQRRWEDEVVPTTAQQQTYGWAADPEVDIFVGA